MSKNRQSPISNDIINAIFGPPPILEGEDAGAYEALLKRLSAAIIPTDIVEQIWVHDLAAYTWEIFRWRRIKIDLVKTRRTKALEKFIEPFIDESGHDEERPEPKNGRQKAAALQRVALIPIHELPLAEAWAAKDPTAVEAIDTLIADGYFTMDEVTSAAFVAKLKKIERVDDLISNAEKRRNVVLREIDRRRASLARAVFREAEDAEFETIELPARTAESSSKKNAA
jgi:hypothetical protein